MIKFLCPFLINDIRQIPDSLVRQYDLGLEAICFDGRLLRNLDGIERHIRQVQRVYPQRLRSFHFPTEHADYLHDRTARTRLFQLIDLCSKNGIRKVIVHSNFFQSVDEFKPEKLDKIREQYLRLFADIDRHISDHSIELLVENMPIIGNEGSDFDSVFVFPEDFAGFKKFNNVRINWDLGHWAFTVKFMDEIRGVSKATSHIAIDFFDFKKILPLVGHCHASSFHGLAFPMTSGICEEGYPFHLGDTDPILFKKALRLIDGTLGNPEVSLEISEYSYYQRGNLRKTLRWLRANDLT